MAAHGTLCLFRRALSPKTLITNNREERESHMYVLPDTSAGPRTNISQCRPKIGSRCTQSLAYITDTHAISTPHQQCQPVNGEKKLGTHSHFCRPDTTRPNACHNTSLSEIYDESVRSQSPFDHTSATPQFHQKLLTDVYHKSVATQPHYRSMIGLSQACHKSTTSLSHHESTKGL